MEIDNIVVNFEALLLRFFRSRSLQLHANSLSSEEIFAWWTFCVIAKWSELRGKKLTHVEILPLTAFFAGYKPKALELINSYLNCIEDKKLKYAA